MKSLVLMLGVLCVSPGSEGKRGEILNNQKVLGRHVALGGLYNARKSEFFGGMSFWNHTTILHNKIKYPAINQNSYSFFEQTIDDRMACLDIGAELKLDFLGGLIHVEGAASYLKDSKELETTIRHNTKFESTSHSEVIPRNLRKDDPSYCELTGEDAPTHVVNQIKYGVNAIFVFEKTVSKTESKEKITGELKVVVKSLPSFQIEGSASLKVEGNTTKWKESLRVTFYGDVLLDKQPSTLEDASKIFNEIADKARVNPQPITYSLMPISYYCSIDDTILNKLADNTRDDAIKILGEMEQTEMKIRTLLATDVAGRFRGIEKALLAFKNNLGKFKIKFSSDLRKLLIKAKMDKTAETEISQLLQTYKESPFEFGRSQYQLKIMTREIESINLVTGQESSATYEVTDEASGNDNACLFNYEHSLFYELNVLGKITDQDKNQKRWFDSNSLIGKSGELFRRFLEFSKTNHGPKCCFMVQLKELSPEPVTLVAFKNGEVLTNNFNIPHAPVNVTKIASNFDSIVIGCSPTQNQDISNVVVEYQAANALPHDDWEEVEGSVNNDVAVTGLTPMTKYKMKMRFKTEIGISADSEEIEVMTLMSSPPSDLVVKSLDPFSLEVSFQPPNDMPQEIKGNIVYQVTCNNRRVQEAPYTFTNLEPATHYDISVMASYRKEIVNTKKIVVSVENYESLPATTKGTTIPQTMQPANIASLSATSATISWDIPKRAELASGSVIDNFKVIYSRTDNGDETERVTVGPVNSIEIGDLASGVQYEVTVQVRTSAGNSLRSAGKRFTTPWEKTDLEKFKDTLGLAGIRSQIENNEKTCNTKIDQLKRGHSARINLLDTKTTVLGTSVAICGYNMDVSTTGVMTYTSLSISHSSDRSALDMRTGKYRANTAGVYSLAWGGNSYGGGTEILLYKGTTQVAESMLYSYRAGADMATRAMSICLKKGEEVYLKADRVDGYIHWLTFCVTLSTATTEC